MQQDAAEEAVPDVESQALVDGAMEPEPEFEEESDLMEVTTEEPPSEGSLREQSLRAELDALKLTALQTRAIEVGVDESALDEANDNNAVVDLIVRKVQERHHRGQIRELLRSVDAFKDFTKEDELEKIVNALEIRSFSEGETVIMKGQHAKAFYIIKAGAVGIDLGDGETIRTQGMSESFGEIALLEECPRTATVIAQTDCVSSHAICRCL